jgi:predicted amidohydrolase
MKLKVALLQLASGSDKLVNLNHAAIKIKEAATKGADLVVLPECFQSPYSIDCFREYAETLGGPTQQMLSKTAKELSVYLIGGSIPELENGKIYNTSYVYDPQGKLIATHRKVHLFDINVPGKISFQESLVLSAGSSLNYFEIPAFGRIGLGICYDVRFPELAMIMARKYGVVAMIYPGAFNMITGPLHWELLLRSRSLDNQIFVAGCAPARNENASYIAWGHSTSVNPAGVVIGNLKGEEGILMTIWDSQEVSDARSSIPTSSQRRFDVYPDITTMY